MVWIQTSPANDSVGTTVANSMFRPSPRGMGQREREETFRVSMYIHVCMYI